MALLQGCCIVFLPTTLKQNKAALQTLYLLHSEYPPSPQTSLASWTGASLIQAAAQTAYTKLPHNFQQLAGICPVAVCSGVGAGRAFCAHLIQRLWKSHGAGALVGRGV